MTQYNIGSEGSGQSGIGDAVVSGFISPKVSKVTWGAGPVFLVPTGSDAFSANKFGIGPTAVALYLTSGMTFGALVNQIWSVAGDENRGDVSSLFLQPFLPITGKPGQELVVTLNSPKTGKPMQRCCGLILSFRR